MEETDVNFRNKFDPPWSLALSGSLKICDHRCVTLARFEGRAEPGFAQWWATHTYPVEMCKEDK